MMNGYHLVAAGLSPAVEPGILPGGIGPGLPTTQTQSTSSGRRDAALYGRRDACRYVCRIALVGSLLAAALLRAAPGDPPCAQLPPGTIAIRSPSQPGRYSLDRGLGRIETASEAAGDVVAVVLKTPSLGNAQLEAAVGVVQFAFAPFAAGYGALRGAHHKLTPEQLDDAERQLEKGLDAMAQQDQLRQCVFQSAGEKSSRHFVELAPGKTVDETVSGWLETQVDSLRLKRTSHGNYHLTITAQARLLNAANGQVLAESPYHYTSDEAMFIDWARAGGLESVALTGYHVLAEQIARDFFAPRLEPPILLGAGNPSAPFTRPVLLASRKAMLAPSVQFVGYQVADNGAFEIRPGLERPEVLIREPEETSVESTPETQTDTEWKMDGLVNNRNFVVQAAACLAAVPLGLWEQTIGAIGRAAEADRSQAETEIQQLTRHRPVQQELADEIARCLAPRTSQTVVLRKLPATFAEPIADQPVRISAEARSSVESANHPQVETSLTVRLVKVELAGNRAASHRARLSLEAQVTLARTVDGQELCVWRVHYYSTPRRLKDWSAHDGALLQQELNAYRGQVGSAVVAQLLATGCVAPRPVNGPTIAQN